MNNFSKLILSDEELQLVNNPEWILTKRVIIDKISSMLGEIAEKQKAIIQQEKEWLPAAVLQSDAKISKGENYLQLPFLILDNPRCFDAENIFAVRTMFWWGNFFSVTLQLSGTYKTQFQQQLIKRLSELQHSEFYLCINETQWHHHFRPDNYIETKKISSKETAEIITQKKFIKLAKRFPLQKTNDVSALLENAFEELLNLIKA